MSIIGYMDNKKIKKNLYLPSWIVESLDKEAKIAGGAGVVAGAAIYHFCSINKKERAEILEKYHKRDNPIDTILKSK